MKMKKIGPKGEGGASKILLCRSAIAMEINDSFNTFKDLIFTETLELRITYESFNFGFTCKNTKGKCEIKSVTTFCLHFYSAVVNTNLWIM